MLIQRSNDWYDRERVSTQSASDPTCPSSPLMPASLDQPFNGGCIRQRSPIHLSPGWQPIPRFEASSQQSKTVNRPRHSSLSDHQSHSLHHPARAPGFRNTQDTHSSTAAGRLFGLRQHSSNHLFATPPSRLNYSSQVPRGRIASSYTVPNPNTSSLSDLHDLNYPSNEQAFPAPQDDLAQIASNFGPEQRADMDLPGQDLQSPSVLENEAPGPSQQFSISIEAIRALIEHNGSDQPNQNVAFLERVMKAGFEKLWESQPPSCQTKPSCASVITQTLSSTSDATDSRGAHACPLAGCTRTANRRCDLKKHIKRHLRPFGCTFSKCYEKFGSKYDWKRHERTVHHQQECWKCAQCTSTARKDGQRASASGLLFYTEMQFEDHLRDVHAVKPDKIREHLAKQRIGRDSLTRFWCGFCEKIVPLQKKGIHGSNERCDHIGDHFKRGQKIKDWIDLDTNVAKGECPKADSESDEDDVLGDVLRICGIMSGRDDRKQRFVGKAAAEDDSSEIDIDAGGQKRSLPTDVESFSSVDTRPARRQRTAGSRPSDLASCCYCDAGPSILSLNERCLCGHDFCQNCKYLDRHGEALKSRR